MKISTAFPTKYVSAPDLNGKSCIVTIADVGQEMVGRPPEMLPVLYFRGTSKGLVLNKTNGKAIAFLHGDETDDWMGKQIELYPTTTEFGADIVACIRVRGPGQVPIPGPVAPQGNGGGFHDHQAPPAAAPLGQPVAAGDDDLDDSIPFS